MRRADVVHVHLFPAQLWAALAAATLPPRVRPVLVTTEHNTTNRRRGSRALHALDRWMYGRYDRIAAISEAAGASLAEWVPGTREKTCIIHSAVDVDRFAAAAPASRRDALGISEDTPVLVCVGRYEAQKDQATLIRALTHLPGWHAALVGDGELRPNLAAQAQATGVAERVHLLGRRADVPALVAMADVYAQPSLYEGWSVAVLEAMACGRAPVVASRAPGLADAVAGRGLLFEPGDADALAACVRRLRENPTESAALVNNARAWVENFRIERYVEAHQALYQEVTAMKQRGR
jgi:glycosyltransferase involved in cell wall biosynthesis